MFTLLRNALYACFIGLALAGCASSQANNVIPDNPQRVDTSRASTKWVRHNSHHPRDALADKVVRNAAGEPTHFCRVTSIAHNRMLHFAYAAVGQAASSSTLEPIKFLLHMSTARERRMFMSVCGMPPLADEYKASLAS